MKRLIQAGILFCLIALPLSANAQFVRRHVGNYQDSGLGSSGGTLTGPLLLPDGTSALPSLSFALDRDTGFYRFGSNQIGFSAGSTSVPRLRLSSSVLDFYGTTAYSSSGILELGTAMTSNRALGTGDVGVGGDFEVDGAAHFDAPVNLYSNLSWPTLGDLRLFADDGMHLSANAGDGYGNNNFIFGSTANMAKDYDHDTASTNPTVFFHSATSPDTDNTQWLSVTHDQTDGVVTAGTGDIKLNDEVEATGVSGDGSGKAVCVKADGNLGTCTDAVGAGGTCTCT